MDDDRIRHRRIYAKGYFDGLEAGGGAMTPLRQQSILRGMPTQAQKVFEFVPIAEVWADTRILGEMTKSTRSSIERRVVDGCLDRLRDVGLIREVGRREYQRVRVALSKDDEATDVVPIPVATIAVPADATAAPASAIDLIASISNRLSSVAGEIRQIVSDLETAALQIEEQRTANGREVEELRQLKALLAQVLAGSSAK